MNLLRRPPAVVIVALYVLFAAVVYVAHGPEPTLSIDHLAYFKLADEIRREYPAGDYFRSLNSVRAYGVLLAYLFAWTGSNLVSLKLILATLTVLYLGAFQLFMGLVSRTRGEAVLFSILSALFVSFGASIWGMTDFAASLNRTLVIPAVVLLVWFFFRFHDSPWRYAIFPGLVVASMAHLSALHVGLAFAAYEVLDWAFRRRFRILDRDIVALVVAGIVSVGLQWGFERIGTGTASYVSTTLATAGQARTQGEVQSPEAPAPGGATPDAPTPPSRSPVKPRDKLTAEEAWEIELFAFPWRNMPPSLATIATIASSYGLILMLALAGFATARRGRWPRPLDAPMARLAAAVLVAAYGLQTLLWALRGFVPMFPINFEEIRVINIIMFPSLYFAYRLREHIEDTRRLVPQAAIALVAAGIALQPIVAVRLLPVAWREGIIDIAIDKGFIKRTDAPRMLYARTFLGLGEEGRRFYYTARPAIAWLERNAGPKDLILTNANDFYVTHLRTTGSFLSIVSMDVWDLQREKWARALDRVDAVLATGDTAQVLALARELGATWAVVTWPVEGAAYRDATFSILRVTP